MIAKVKIIGILIVSYICPLVVLAQNEQELLMSFGDEEFVEIATGRRQHVSKAPAIASVITERDIRAIGATDIDQILEVIPGLHVSVSSSAYRPIYVIRGIYSEFNPQVLLLVDGAPITNAYIGDRSQVWGGMPVESIARIEVIRGPGSAIYGADAFSGVINIITKNPNQIHPEVGLRAGSFSTQDGWLLTKFKFGEWDMGLSLEYHETDGIDEVVESDLQSQFDMIFGTSASLAPGNVNTGVESLDTRISLTRNQWDIRFGYQGRTNVGTGAGVAQTLDPRGQLSADRTNLNVAYETPDLGGSWNLKLTYGFFRTEFESKNLALFPAGAILPVGSDGNVATPGGGIVLFSDGLIGNPGVSEDHHAFGVDMFYEGFDRHVIRFGLGASKVDLTASETKNFGPGVIDGTEGIVNAELTKVTDTSFVFVPDESRDLTYAFFQDEWSVTSDWNLTAGLRYDNYSDFGNTTNPRLALVWQARYNITAKLLYGKAFRAPSFAEQFNINNPVVLGNSNLEPETIDTVEFAVDYASAGDQVHFGVNVFKYEMEDIIRFAPEPSTPGLLAQNLGKQEGQGLEWELKWDINSSFRLTANMAWQKSKDKNTNSDVANAPAKQLYIRGDWNLTSSFQIHAQANYVADRVRDPSDLRQPVDDYTAIDFTLRYAPDSKGAQFAFLIKNAFDADIREPSLAPGAIVNDFPVAGRFMQIEYRYSW